MSLSAPTAVVAEDEAPLRDELVEQLGKLWPELSIVGEAADGLEALRLLDQQQPDILFLDIQMAGMDVFSPNDATHPEFGAALREAARAGVKVLAVECGVTPRSLVMTRPVSVALQGRRKDSAPGGTL